MGFIDLVFGDRGEKKRALLERARKHFRHGRVEKALEHAERAIKLDPEGAESRETLGRVYFRMGLLAWTDGSPKDAIECFTDAARLLNDPLVLFHRGLVYRDTRQYLKAIDDFSRILRSEEIHVVPLATYATFSRGICYREKGDHRFAAKDFTTCILMDEHSPLRHRFFAHRALCRAALGEAQEAAEDLAQAAALAPRSAEIAHARELLATMSAPVARPALPAGRSQSQPPPPKPLPTPPPDDLDELGASSGLVGGRCARVPVVAAAPAAYEEPIHDLDAELHDFEEIEESTTGRHLMPALGAHVDRGRPGGVEPSDPSETDWTLIPDSSPGLRRPESPAPRGATTPSPLHASNERRAEPRRSEKADPPPMPRETLPPTRAPSTTVVEQDDAATTPDLPAQREPAEETRTAHERLEALKRKRDRAFAEREGLFSGAATREARTPPLTYIEEENASPPDRAPDDEVLRIERRPPQPARERPAAASERSATRERAGAVDAQPTAGQRAAPAERNVPSNERAAPPALPAQPSEKALRCLRKLNQMMEEIDAHPEHLADVDFCVDYLLVVARLRELPRAEKKAVVQTAGHEALLQFETVEAQARHALLSSPEAAPAAGVADEALSLLDAVKTAGLAPAQIPNSSLAEPLRGCIQAFQALSRAQKYLFMDRCGQQRFARFIDLFIVMGGAEQHP